MEPDGVYVAVIGRLPLGNVVVENVTRLPLSGSVLSVTVPRRNVMWPAGVTPAEATVTTAVNVTLDPKIDGFVEDDRLVVVGAGETTYDTMAGVAAVKAALPA